MATAAPDYMRRALARRRHDAHQATLPVVVRRLNKDGSPSRMRDATTRHADIGQAAERIAYWRRINPTLTLRYAIDGTEA
jgi:hypothetical protein